MSRTNRRNHNADDILNTHFMNPQLTQHVFLLIYWTAMSTPMWPPLIYYTMNSRFKVGFKYAAYRVCPCLCTKFDVQEYESSDLFDKKMVHRTVSNYGRTQSTSTAGERRSTILMLNVSVLREIITCNHRHNSRRAGMHRSACAAQVAAVTRRARPKCATGQWSTVRPTSICCSASSRHD